MARVKRGNVAVKRRKKILKHNKGFVGPLSKLFRPAHQAYLHALNNAYRDRRRKKRDFRRLWIQRINAALLPHGISYSRFIAACTKENVVINRKMLSELAIHQPDAFNAVVHTVKKSINSKSTPAKAVKSAPVATKTAVDAESVAVEDVTPVEKEPALTND